MLEKGSKATIMNIGFGTNGNHTVTAYGSMEYQRNGTEVTVGLLQVYDGWSKDPRFIDFNGMRKANSIKSANKNNFQSLTGRKLLGS